MRNDYRERILKTLDDAELPLDVENIRTRTGIKNWQTTAKLCLELIIEKRIQGIKSSKGWTFWKKEEPSDEQSRAEQ